VGNYDDIAIPVKGQSISSGAFGKKVRAAIVDLDSRLSGVSELESPPMCHLVQQTAQTGWTSNTLTAITFGTGSEVIDTDAIHSEGSNTSRLQIGLKLGWWEVSGVYAAASNSATTIIRAAMYKNGVVINGSFGGDQLSTTGSFYTASTPVLLVEATSSTDYVELYGHQTAASGTIGTAINSSMVASSITAVWRRKSL
jgi:hypothetical protein